MASALLARSFRAGYHLRLSSQVAYAFFHLSLMLLSLSAYRCSTLPLYATPQIPSTPNPANTLPTPDPNSLIFHLLPVHRSHGLFHSHTDANTAVALGHRLRDREQNVHGHDVEGRDAGDRGAAYCHLQRALGCPLMSTCVFVVLLG
jgi:hypothetical protein